MKAFELSGKGVAVDVVVGLNIFRGVTVILGFGVNVAVGVKVVVWAKVGVNLIGTGLQAASSIEKSRSRVAKRFITLSDG